MKGSDKKHTLSLYRQFKPGDRVKRTIQLGSNEKHKIEGIILSMDHHQIEVYWDTLDGSYCPNTISGEFTICDFEEVTYGTQTASPVRQKKSILI
jgi:hypothetical protein